MIPYVELPAISLGPLTVHPFGFLAVTAVVVGTKLAQWRARRLGVDETTLNELIGWVLVGGMAGAHVFERVLYQPSDLIEQPWSLLYFWDGLSSMGGFAGAIVGGLLWKQFRGAVSSLLPLADIIVSVLPVAWIFARAGCAVVHDHPGIPTSTDNWLAVAYPGGARYDLGLLEMLLAVTLSVAVVSNWRRRRPVGWYVATVSLVYATVRFALDFLRTVESDPRYGGLTPAQWACMPLFVLGIVVATRLRTGRSDPPTWIAEEHPGSPHVNDAKSGSLRTAAVEWEDTGPG